MSHDATPLVAEQAEQRELQCTDCYRIFTSETPPVDATCEACGSDNVVKW